MTMCLPTIKPDIAGFACWASRLLIQPSLHGLQTTFAFKSIPGRDHCLRILPDLSLWLNRNFFDLNSLRIHLLQMCSPEKLAVAGQNAHSLGMKAFYSAPLGYRGIIVKTIGKHVEPEAHQPAASQPSEISEVVDQGREKSINSVKPEEVATESGKQVCADEVARTANPTVNGFREN